MSIKKSEFKVGDRVRLKGRDIEGIVLYNADISTIMIKFIGDGYFEYCLYRPEELELISRNKSNIETNIIINPPAVILFKDGKKYVAKAQDEPFNAERGLMVALLKSFGIGYSDIQKMLREAKYQKKLDNAETILNRPLTSNFTGNYIDGLIPNEWIDETMVKRPIDNQKQYVNANSIDNDKDGFFSYAMKVLYGNRGNPSGTKIKYPKVVLDAIDEIKQKPKSKRGRPRKFRVGDVVAIKDLDTYKYGTLRLKEDLLNETYKVDRIDCENDVHTDIGWFTPNELELVEKASDKGKK